MVSSASRHHATLRLRHTTWAVIVSVLFMVQLGAPAMAAPAGGVLTMEVSPTLTGRVAGLGPGELTVDDTSDFAFGASGATIVVERVYTEGEYVRNPAGAGPVETAFTDPTRESFIFTDATFSLDGMRDGFETLFATRDDGIITTSDLSVAAMELVAHKNPYLVTDDAGKVQPEDDSRYTYAADGVRVPVPASHPVIEGGFTMYLTEAEFSVTDGEGTRRAFEAGTYEEDTGAATYRAGEAWYLVTFVDGLAELMGSGITAWLGDGVIDLSGTLEAAQATGVVRVGGDRHEADAVRVVIEGVLTIEPRAAGTFQPADGLATTGTQEQIETGTYTGVAAEMDGEVTSLSVGDRAVSLAAADLGVAATATVGTLAFFGAVFAFTQKGKWALLSIMAPLYAKTEKDRLLDNGSRERIYQAICENPGINLSQVHRIAELGWGVTVYHLKMLEKNGLVFSEARSRDRCFFENTPRNRAMQDAIAALANKEPVQRIAQVVIDQPGLNQRQVVERTGVSQRAASYYLSKLSNQGLVDTRREKNFARYFPDERLLEALPIVSASAAAIASAGANVLDSSPAAAGVSA